MSNTHNNDSLNTPYENSDDAESVADDKFSPSIDSYSTPNGDDRWFQRNIPNEFRNESWRNRNNSSHVYLNNHKKKTNILHDDNSNHNSDNNNGGISTDVESEELSSLKKRNFLSKIFKNKKKTQFLTREDIYYQSYLDKLNSGLSQERIKLYLNLIEKKWNELKHVCIAVSGTKGGVGKTFTALGITYAALRNFSNPELPVNIKDNFKKILLIDLDDNGSLNLRIKVDTEHDFAQVVQTASNVRLNPSLAGTLRITDLISKVEGENNLWFSPSPSLLGSLNTAATLNAHMYAMTIYELKNIFDLVILDMGHSRKDASYYGGLSQADVLINISEPSLDTTRGILDTGTFYNFLKRIAVEESNMLNILNKDINNLRNDENISLPMVHVLNDLKKFEANIEGKEQLEKLFTTLKKPKDKEVVIIPYQESSMRYNFDKFKPLVQDNFILLLAAAFNSI